MRTIPSHRLGAAAAALLLLAGAACGSDAEADSARDLPTLQDSSVDDGSSETGEDGGTPSDLAGDDGGEPETDVDPDLAMQQWEECMADQGIEVQMATVDEAAGPGATVEDLETSDQALESDVVGTDLSEEDFEAAAAECDPLLEAAFGSFELTPEQEAELADFELALERCLTEHGLEVDFGGGASFEIGDDDDFEAFEAAFAACEQQLPELSMDEEG